MSMWLKCRFISSYDHHQCQCKFLPCVRMLSKIMHMVVSVCVCTVYVCMWPKILAVWGITTRKSAECILLLSHWVQTPPVWVSMSSKLYRQSSSCFFQVRCRTPPQPKNIFFGALMEHKCFDLWAQYNCGIHNYPSYPQKTAEMFMRIHISEDSLYMFMRNCSHSCCKGPCACILQAFKV